MGSGRRIFVDRQLYFQQSAADRKNRQAKRGVPSHYYFESGSLDTLMRIVDCTQCVTIIPEMAVEYVPKEHRDRVKTLAKGATSRKIAIAVRRTFVKSSIIKALAESIRTYRK